jgi:hypothetical protein
VLQQVAGDAAQHDLAPAGVPVGAADDQVDAFVDRARQQQWADAEILGVLTLCFRPDAVARCCMRSSGICARM